MTARHTFLIGTGRVEAGDAPQVPIASGWCSAAVLPQLWLIPMRTGDELHARETCSISFVVSGGTASPRRFKQMKWRADYTTDARLLCQGVQQARDTLHA